MVVCCEFKQQFKPKCPGEQFSSLNFPPTSPFGQRVTRTVLNKVLYCEIVLMLYTIQATTNILDDLMSLDQVV